ncbi:hypothetical protein F8388_000526 [Cannabis sativa]|uniref:DYW domain-containing protein n=1 Tax=Cannabis sativa TaxID=3483 RepID=A0A7J6EZI7_CANSA|nr:hypothetical protein F8388_000526 [Cannabis sativa]
MKRNEPQLLLSSPPRSPQHQALLLAGPRIRPLQQLHAHFIVSGCHHNLPLLTKLLTLACTAGSIAYTHRLFNSIPNPDSFLFNSLIKASSFSGFSQDAIFFYNRMIQCGIFPSSYTFTSVIKSCADLSSCWVHDYVIENDFYVNVVLGTSLINMYAKCGNVSKAQEVFDSMNERNVIAWTAIISAHGVHGYGNQAMKLFLEMKTECPNPNSVTFVAVLSACAHSGLVEEGRKVYASMGKEYGLVPGIEHHVCLVDMLGRAGLLTEAYRFIKELDYVEPAPAIWTAMLGACKMHKNFVLGVEVAEHLLAVEPDNPGHYVMLSNIYALAGRMDRVEIVRKMMNRRRLKKQVGFSTIEVDHKTYVFSMGDKSHYETTEIYRYLDDLMSQCRELGYVPAPDSVLHELEEEEREFALRYHSEKLAIAFGLLRTGRGQGSSIIRVVKNLRMCEDCHLGIKYISILTKREIIVRDKLRFHHFKDGHCSCLDYW